MENGEEVKVKPDPSVTEDFKISPWDVTSVEDFLYYCCPECNDRNQSRDDFLQHAMINHPKANEYLVHFVVKEEFTNDKYDTDIDNDNFKISVNHDQPDP